MSKVAILASVFALAVGTTGCGNSQGQSNSLVDVAPSLVSSTSSEQGGTLATMGKPSGGGGGGKKGGGTTTTGGGSLSLVMWVDNNHDGLPNFNDTVTFDVSTTATTQPSVAVICKQNGATVYNAMGEFYDGGPFPWTRYFPLSSPSWTTGDADCTASLVYGSGNSTVTLATITFHVYA